MAVIVVDESVLALSNYVLGNPLNTFYPQRPPEPESLRFSNRKHIAAEVVLLAFS